MTFPSDEFVVEQNKDLFRSDDTAVSYQYYLAGAGSPKVGQLQSVSSSNAGWYASTQHDNYDDLGRVVSSSHTISGDSTRNFIYSYRLNDSVNTVTNPSGRVIQYDVDDAGRAARVYSGATVYADLTATNAPYSADGRIAQMKLGNNVWETWEYQTPGTPTRFKIGTSQGGIEKLELVYNFSGSENNGNLESHIIRQPGREWTQQFYYDDVNRLEIATEIGGWSRTYGYDAFGNRWVAGSSPNLGTETHEPTVQTNFNATNNHLSVAGSYFDSVGNQQFFAPWTLGYDAENRNTTVTSPLNGSGVFSYDGEGRRVKKVWAPYGGSPTTTYYVYNALGQLAAEYSTASAPAITSYVHADMLGSTRMVTSGSGETLEWTSNLQA